MPNKKEEELKPKILEDSSVSVVTKTGDTSSSTSPKKWSFASMVLNLQTKEKAKQATELLFANIELLLQNEERNKRAAELQQANKALKKIKKQQKKYIKDLEEIMFITSHAVRKPITNILGIAAQLDESNLPDECKELIECMKISALSLDVVTQELTSKINNLKEKGNLNYLD